MALPARAIERTYTVEEFEVMPEFGDRYELIEGRLIQKEVPNHQHGRIIQRLNRALTFYDPDEKLGEIAQEVSARLDTKNAPLPDLSFWKAERLPIASEGAAPTPDLAVEVLSPHDLASKKRLEEVYKKVRSYQAAGVSLVWVINPRKQEVEIYHPNQIPPFAILDINKQLDGENVIPGFTLAVKALFE